MQIFQCSKCNQYYIGSICSHCGSESGIQQQDVSIIISESSSLTNDSTTEYFTTSKDIPVESLKSPLDDTELHVVSRRGAYIQTKTDERKVWTGNPSPLMIVVVFLKWLPIILISSIVLGFMKVPFQWEILILFFASVDLILKSLALSFIRYRLSSQRLEITDGLIHQQIRTYEVHHLSDATINMPFPLGLFGISILEIRHIHGDSSIEFPLIRIFHSLPSNSIHFNITLIGIPKEEARIIRDLIRNSGDIEGRRFDKLRIR